MGETAIISKSILIYHRPTATTPTTTTGAAATAAAETITNDTADEKSQLCAIYPTQYYSVNV